jgi:FkbM family methyltransferase
MTEKNSSVDAPSSAFFLLSPPKIFVNSMDNCHFSDVIHKAKTDRLSTLPSQMGFVSAEIYELPLEVTPVLLFAFVLFTRPRIPVCNSSIALRDVRKLDTSSDMLPLVNCTSYSSFPDPGGFTGGVFGQIQSLFGNFSCSRPLLSAWLNRFHPDNLYAQQVLDSFKHKFAVGLQCWRLFNVIPPMLGSYLEEYWRTTQPAEAGKYQGMSNGCTEVFLFHHGLRMLDPRIREPLKNKSFIDIGAFNGDSALALSQYAKDVYSIELATENYIILNRTLAQNPELSRNVRTFHLGVSDRDGETGLTGNSAAARIGNGSGERIKMVTIDTFVRTYNLSVGFMKSDTEGNCLAVVRGAAETMVRDRPVFSFSVYHDFSEMYNVSRFLMDLLPDYYFE